MPGEREARADALLSEALDLPPEERAAFVARACDGDEPLRQLVLELLEDAERPDDFLRPGEVLEGELWQDASKTLGPVAKLSPGTAVGAWRVVREVGGGGMAVVYLAARADGQFQQQAALKLIKAGIDTQETIHRFQQERQILASLDHPNIARLLDGGLTTEGRPFFAMEYIEGEPIDRWCDERHLPLDDRLRLFIDVGHAVEFAHRHLVVHRDLKPSNILVTEQGHVKLLDFGIAKLLDPSAVAYAAPPTRTASRLMTPQYASPEQVRGEPATTASDVYQLGLLLYELLTGCRAQMLSGTSPSEIEQAVCERTPPRPSAATGAGRKAEALGAEAERLRRRLRGDLDNIVMKALRKEPENRYASVSELVEDIERHRSGRPVAARPPTFRYLAGRFVRRNMVGVTVGSLLLISIVAGLVTSLWLARVASVERDRARQEAATARQVSDFLIDTFRLADPGEARGSSVTAVELLDSGARRIDLLSGEPEIQATMKDVIGRVYLSLGLYDPAGRLLNDALDIRRSVFSEPSEAVAESLDHLGRALHEQGSYDEAEALLQQALAMRRELYGPVHPQVAETLRALAVIQHFRRNLDEAQALYEEALEIQRKAGDPRTLEAAKLIRDLGVVEMQQGKADHASLLFEESLEMMRAQFDGDHPEIAETLNALAMSWHNQDDFAKAESLYREALDMRTRVLGPDHPNTAVTRGNLGALFYEQRQFDKAEPIFRETLEMKRRDLGDDHPAVATSMTNLAVLLSVRGNLDEAEPLYREALRIRQDAYGEEHYAVAVSTYYLGRLLWERGKAREAESLMRTALPRLPEKDPNRAALLVDLGDLLLEQVRLVEAEPVIQSAVDLTLEIHGEDYWRTAAARSSRGAWHLARGDREHAQEDLDAAWTVLSQRPPDDARRRKNLERLVRLHQASGNPDEAARFQAILAESLP